MLTIKCDCGEVYFADEQHLGKSLRCKKCGVVLTIQHLVSSPRGNVHGYTSERNNQEKTWKSNYFSTVDFHSWFKNTLAVIGVLVILVLSVLSILLKENTSNKQLHSQQQRQPEFSNQTENTSSERYRERSHNDYFGYPKKYSLGSFDSRFGITKSRFLELIQESKLLWEKPLGTTLFEYDQGASFKINLIFDERQKKTIESEKLKQTLDVDNKFYDKLVDEYNRESDDISNIETEYEIKSNSFKSRQERHNSKIEYWNANGGAPEDEYSQLNAEKYQLNMELNILENERQLLNERISQHNSLAQRINDLAAEYNFNIELFNGKFIESGNFEKGSYDPASNEINIYEFREEADLRIAIAHELGHALGFSHTSDPRSVMYFELKKQDIRHLHLTTQDLSLLKNTFKNY